MAAVSDILIGNRPIGDSHRPLVIAEVAQAHDGSLGTAHAYIDAIAGCRRGCGEIPDAHRRC